MYDEGLVPRDIARELVTEWEVLLRRTTIYLCAWADGIVSLKLLTKYILKGNPEWVKLYRYIWLKSQANYLGVFPTPKTFALATCTGHEADENCRNRLKAETSLPPAKTKDSIGMQIVRKERTIIISDLLLYWISTNSKTRNDISTVAQNWDGKVFSSIHQKITAPR